MKRKWNLFFCLLFLTSCSSVNKETSENSLLQELQNKEKETQEILKEQKLSLEEAIRLAKERNLELKMKELEKEIASIDKRTAFGNFLPKISAFYTRSFWEEPLSAQIDLPSSLGKFPMIGPLLPKEIHGRLLDQNYSVYGMQASMPIFAPATWFLYSARKKGEDIHSLVFDLTEKMITVKVIQQYYWILALKSEEKQLQASLQSAEQLLHNTKIALETQSILDWQYQKAEVYYKQKKLALEENRDVYAIPGDIDSPCSRGCNQLIRDAQAKLLAKMEEILYDYDWNRKEEKEIEVEVSQEAQKILVSLIREKSLDDLEKELFLSKQVLLSQLMQLEIEGWIKSVSGGKFKKIK